MQMYKFDRTRADFERLEMMAATIAAGMNARVDHDRSDLVSKAWRIAMEIQNKSKGLQS